MGVMIPVHVLMFLPAILMGIIGGIMGATFTLLNMRIVKQRMQLINLVSRPAAKKFLRMLEPVIITVSALLALVNQSVNQSINQSINQSVSQSVSQS